MSVCIANYNGESLLDDCLRSVAQQEFSGTFEILVHDDASTDRSVDFLAARYPNVIVIASRQNVGYCTANNRMAEAASGDFLLLLNNDAALRPQALQALVSAARKALPMSVLTLPQYDWNSGRLVDRGVRLDFLHTPVPNRAPDDRRLAYVQGACLFVRRDTWRKVGGFPEWMGSNAEDVYLCTLVRLRGGRILVATGSGYDHRQGASFGGNRPQAVRMQTTYRRRYLSERNRASLVFVCTPTWAAWPCYVLHLVVLLIEGAAVAAGKGSTVIWRRIYWPAVRDSFRALPALRRARRGAQRGRRIGFWRYVRVFDLVPHKLVVLLRRGMPELR